MNFITRTSIECASLCLATSNCYFFDWNDDDDNDDDDNDDDDNDDDDDDNDFKVCRISTGKNIVPPKSVSFTVYADLTFPGKTIKSRFKNCGANTITPSN